MGRAVGRVAERALLHVVPSVQRRCVHVPRRNVGPYNPDESDVHTDFREYHGMALHKGLLPDRCKGDFVTPWYTRERCMYSIEKSDVVERFGYASGTHRKCSALRLALAVAFQASFRSLLIR